ncbi:Hypothetical_protein [Hexamita inflata]|uniref:Hypothetical_protein n=1 Tax=Hexamita inflata TaxID=28002 RepID=A0ABP1HGC7_9EUKA
MRKQNHLDWKKDENHFNKLEIHQPRELLKYILFLLSYSKITSIYLFIAFRCIVGLLLLSESCYYSSNASSALTSDAEPNRSYTCIVKWLAYDQLFCFNFSLQYINNKLTLHIIHVSSLEQPKITEKNYNREMLYRYEFKVETSEDDGVNFLVIQFNKDLKTFKFVQKIQLTRLYIDYCQNVIIDPAPTNVTDLTMTSVV